MLVKIGEVAKHFGVTTQTIRDWTEKGQLKCTTTPSGTRLYDLNALEPGDGRNDSSAAIFYCRVSSKKQTKDLERQVSKAKALYPEAEIVTDIGSGLNWKRKGLRSIIDKTLQGKIREIKVFHKDRLCRFGFEILEYIFNACDVRIVVCEHDAIKSPEQEFAEDLIEITHYFSCSLYGKRKYTFHEDENSQTEDKRDENSEENDGTIQKNI